MDCTTCGMPAAAPAPAHCQTCGSPWVPGPPWPGKLTRLPPAEAVGRVAAAMVARGASTSTYSPAAVGGTLTVQRKVDVVAAVALFLLCVVPMIVYLVRQSRADVYNWLVQAAPEGTGARVTFRAQGPAGRAVWVAIEALPA